MKNKRRHWFHFLLSLTCVFLIMFNSCFVSFAADNNTSYLYNVSYHLECKVDDTTTYSLNFSIHSNGYVNVYRNCSKRYTDKYSLGFVAVSDVDFQVEYNALENGVVVASDNVLCTVSNYSFDGVPYSHAWTKYSLSNVTYELDKIDPPLLGIFDLTDLGLSSHDKLFPAIARGEVPYFHADYVPDEGGGDITVTTVNYDSSIPAPQNLRFNAKSVGGFLGIGSKFEHELSWSNGSSTPPLYARISAVASVDVTAGDQPFEDSTVALLPATQEGGYQADIGRYSIGTDEIANKILPGTSLNKVLEYRVQFYRFVDGKLKVGPVSTIHIKTNLFGKYDGYTVTTEYPKDPDNIGDSGGTDDFYDNNWTSDGSHYDEYDKNGNLTDSGTSEDDGGPIDKLLKSLKNIPLLISSFFSSVGQLFAGIGEFPSLIAKLFTFLPSEIIAIIGLGISVVIVLRILGR